jgi:hypothetical protein
MNGEKISLWRILATVALAFALAGVLGFFMARAVDEGSIGKAMSRGLTMFVGMLLVMYATRLRDFTLLAVIGVGAALLALGIGHRMAYMEAVENVSGYVEAGANQELERFAGQSAPRQFEEYVQYRLGSQTGGGHLDYLRLRAAGWSSNPDNGELRTGGGRSMWVGWILQAVMLVVGALLAAGFASGRIPNPLDRF